MSIYQSTFFCLVFISQESHAALAIVHLYKLNYIPYLHKNSAFPSKVSRLSDFWCIWKTWDQRKSNYAGSLREDNRLTFWQGDMYSYFFLLSQSIAMLTKHTFLKNFGKLRFQMKVNLLSLQYVLKEELWAVIVSLWQFVPFFSNRIFVRGERTFLHQLVAFFCCVVLFCDFM